MMKKLILCAAVLMLMLVSVSALAAAGDEALIADTLRRAGITEPVQLSQWGDTAACFAEMDGVKRLVLLEKHDGAWRIVIDNPTALIQDRDWPELLLDSDNAVFWTYILSDMETVRYHSSRDEASAQMESGNYAMVVNPNPADRLHLRERADKDSRSQGKYYTGTPVGVTAQDGDWTQAVIGDWNSWVHGYMMRRYLTFGQSGSALRLDLSAMPQLTAKSGKLKVYKEPQVGEYIWHTDADYATMKVIGVIGDEWYHVWFPATGEYGFVRQSDLSAGNG